MSQPPRKPSIDLYRNARFREEARGILFKDRDHRKCGRAVDTAGAIARALERAYREGFAAADGPAPKPSVQPRPDGPLDWALIPPRPRSAFWSCCLFTFGRRGGQAASWTPRAGRHRTRDPGLAPRRGRSRPEEGDRRQVDRSPRQVGSPRTRPRRSGAPDGERARPCDLGPFPPGRRTIPEDNVLLLILTTDVDTVH